VQQIIIDLNSKSLNEIAGSYRTFGNQVKLALKAMFGGISMPTTVKGSKQDIQSFLDTLVKEKKYMMAYMNYGLDDARTYRNKATLDLAVSKFERVTGIVWPFK
jgi:hypothetical protein